MNNVVESKKCKSCGINFNILQEDLDFYYKISPTLAGVKYELPAPNICPTCRQQQRCSFRNRRNLYKRKCDLTGRNIISMYSPDKPFKVYYNDDYESKIDTIDYGRNFDFSRSFFEQMKELQLDVPRFHAAVVTKTIENAKYINGAHGVINGYLSFSVTECEDVYYCEGIYNSKNCFDCYHVYSCEMCYECIESSKLHKSMYCSYCNNSNNLYFCNSCEGCDECFGCVNLVNKKYCIENKQYTKDEYRKKIGNYKYTRDNIKLFNNELKKLKEKHPVKSTRTINGQNCIGDDLINTKNCYHCFGSENDEDMRYCYFINDSKNCMDMLYFGSNLEHAYRSVSIGMNSHNIYFCLECYDSVNNLFYCDNCCGNVKDCFGCIGLSNKQHCILNKQYTKKEYYELIPKIISHMKSIGERGYFFPTSYSPFGYNESFANEHFPVENDYKNKIISEGYNRLDKEYDIDIPEKIEIINPSELSKDINEIDNSILKKAIMCNTTKKPFRIIPKELEFYVKMKIGLPTTHYNQRHKNRFSQINKKKIFEIKCYKCKKTTKTTYSDNKYKIYCETCYNKEIYG